MKLLFPAVQPLKSRSHLSSVQFWDSIGQKETIVYVLQLHIDNLEQVWQRTTRQVRSYEEKLREWCLIGG